MLRIASIILFAGLVINPSDLFGQSLLFEQYSLREGLSQSSPSGLVQDEQGFLWIATEAGLNRFDGTEFKVFMPEPGNPNSLANMWLSGLDIDEHNRIWIATWGGGISVFDPLAERFKTYRYSPSDSSGLAIDQVVLIRSLDGLGIYAGTESGLARYEEGEDRFVSVDLPLLGDFDLNILPVDAIGRDALGKLLVGFRDLGLLSYDTNTGEVQQLLVKGRDIEEGVILDIWTDDQTRTWVASREGVFILEEGGISRKISRKEGLPTDIISDVAQDLDGNYWVSGNGGLARLNADFEVEAVFTRESHLKFGLLEDFLTGVYVDHSNNLWVRSSKSGLLKADLKPQKFERLDLAKPNVLSDQFMMVWDIEQDENGNYWVGTDAGLMLLNKKREFLNYYPSGHISKGGIPLVGVTSAIPFGSQIYMTNGKPEVVVRDINKGSHRSISIVNPEDNTPISVLGIENFDNRLWLMTYSGLWEMDRYTGAYQKVKLSGSPYANSEVVWDLSQDKQGRLWVSTSTGVYAYSPETYDVRLIEVPSYILDHISASVYDEPYLWVASNVGLFRRNLETGDSLLIDKSSGLYTPNIYSMIRNKPGEIWLGTSLGLGRVNYSYSNPDSFFVRVYDDEDGLGNLEYNSGAMLLSEDGTMLFGGTQGIDVVNPSTIATNTYPAYAAITSAYTQQDGITQSYNSSQLGDWKLRSGIDLIGFKVAALEFTQPQLNSIRYRLGEDEEWITRRAGEDIIIPNPRSGSFNLQIQAANNDGIWHNQISSIQFDVVPPFWKSSYFFALGVFVFLGGLVFFIQYRERSLERQRETLEMEILLQTKELRERETIFRMITENALDLIAIVDVNGKFEYLSPSYAQQVGYTPNELLGRNILDLVHDDEKHLVENSWARIKEYGQGFFKEYRMRHSDGSWRVYDSSGSRVSDTVEQGEKYVFVTHDVTEQREITEKLKKSRDEAEQASRSKSAFVASMSHELKTPLNSVIGFSQIMSGETNITPRQKSYLTTIYDSGTHLLEMINEIIDLSKIEAGSIVNEPINFDLEFLTNELKKRFNKWNSNHGHGFKMDVDSDLPNLLHADYDKILRVASHILNNAVKYSDGGDVYMVFRRAESGKHPNPQNAELEHKSLEAFSKDYDAEHGLHIIIGDYGPGISEERLEESFKPFSQTDPNFSSGIGLGLSVSWRFIQLMNGEMDIYTSKGKGTEIHFRIPFEPVESADSGNDVSIDININFDKDTSLVFVHSGHISDRLIERWLGNAGINVFSVFHQQLDPFATEKLNVKMVLVSNRIPFNDALQEYLDKLDGKVPKMVYSDADNIQKHWDAFESYVGKDAAAFLTQLSELTGSEISHGTQQQLELGNEKDTYTGILNAVNKLDEGLKNQVLDAIDLMDIQELKELIAQNDLNGSLGRLMEALDDNDYSFLITLNEKLNPA